MGDRKEDFIFAAILAAIAAASALVVFMLSGCVSNAETGGWDFAPVEAVKVAATKVGEIPDETKADALEALAWLLGCTGAGAVAVPAVSGAAAYFRRRSASKGAAKSEETCGQEGEVQKFANACSNAEEESEV